MHASDMGDYPTAFRYLEGSVELARGCGDQRQQAWSLSILARAHLLRDERSQAAAALAGSLELVQEQRWVAFLPFPEALKGELDLRAGRVDAAGNQFEHAWSLACRLGDPAALAAARLLAAGIDNPALMPLLDGVRSGA
jgi:hypothetical protein